MTEDEFQEMARQYTAYMDALGRQLGGICEELAECCQVAATDLKEMGTWAKAQFPPLPRSEATEEGRPE